MIFEDSAAIGLLIILIGGPFWLGWLPSVPSATNNGSRGESSEGEKCYVQTHRRRWQRV